jgi:hypothetical protein
VIVSILKFRPGSLTRRCKTSTKPVPTGTGRCVDLSRSSASGSDRVSMVSIGSGRALGFAVMAARDAAGHSARQPLMIFDLGLYNEDRLRGG